MKHKMKHKIYALYKGETLLADGTTKEIAEKMNYKNADVAKSKKSNCLSKVKIKLAETFNRMKR